ncbi:MAG: cyclopropane-fatty-acyl-phospholipid synthase family protein [Planctomycetota bacterium]
MIRKNELVTNSLLAKAVLARLERITVGSLALRSGDATRVLGTGGEPFASVEVHDERFWGAVALRGSIGAGEAYAAGWWTSGDPTSVVRLFVRNADVLGSMESGFARLSKPVLALWHKLRRNTESGSRANIAAHYDLSNEFFGLFLDETMTYSCGIFEDATCDMREASIAKIDRLCRKLDLGPRTHLLEIGTGWGALAVHAAREYGCRVTTTTISRRQHEVAEARIREAGLEGRVTLLLEDYRNLRALDPSARFDRLVSVEMIEAVGHQYYETFYRECSELLAPDGLMAMQAITIADAHYERARRSVDFIQRHVFPGSCIPSVTALHTAMSRASDLTTVHLEDFGDHYVKTLATWRRNLRERWDEAKALGLSEEFLRLWEFYFAYCEGGFAERHIGVCQMLHAKPLARTVPEVAPLPRAVRAAGVA